MQLSVVIVNYNVKCFLEQCLLSVQKASEGLEVEVWVVDNNSVDGSVEMVREKFPWVRLIANADNPGFAKANNQALRQAAGKYMLLLNPDTVVEHDTFRKCVDFMEAHPDCGGLGVKMINGEGKFLKESKRGFPTPEASFFKISGLIRLFPHNRRIAAYYMGHLPDDETNEIDVLAGAYLLVSRAAIEKVGYLDETFFMYGEDIDFSWRIKLAGFKNYYLPSARIIHYKGESTKKGSMNYVYTFYNAMVIFAKKYLSGSKAKMYIALINIAIWMRAGLSFMKRIAQRVALPLADFAAAFAGFMGIKYLWATFWAENVCYYPPVYTFAVIPVYILILMLCMWLYGGYERPVRLWRIVKGMGIGALILLAFYSLLDEHQRYSRAVLLLGSLWTIVSTLTVRGLLSAAGLKGFALHDRKRNACIVVGSDAETQRVEQLYRRLGKAPKEVVRVTPSHTDQLSDYIRIHKAEEVAFCGEDLTSQEIITLMSRLQTTGVEFRIVPSESDYLIGSDDIGSAEQIPLDLNSIDTHLNRRNKRLFDITASLLLVLFAPLLFWFQRRKKLYFKHCFAVLAGRRTWVGFAGRPGIFYVGNVGYASNYKLGYDLSIVLKNIFNI